MQENTEKNTVTQNTNALLIIRTPRCQAIGGMTPSNPIEFGCGVAAEPKEMRQRSQKDSLLTVSAPEILFIRAIAFLIPDVGNH